jgi:hypothetical protein
MNRPWTAAERDPLQEREVDVDEAGQAISIGRIKYAIAGTGFEAGLNRNFEPCS